jgi:hypothetical protein
MKAMPFPASTALAGLLSTALLLVGVLPVVGADIGVDPTRFAGPTVSCGDDLPFGDVDGNGRVDPLDAMWILEDIAELPLPEGGGGCSSHDVDCNDAASSVDALKILRYVAGLPYSQREPCQDIGSRV